MVWYKLGAIIDGFRRFSSRDPICSEEKKITSSGRFVARARRGVDGFVAYTRKHRNFHTIRKTYYYIIIIYDICLKNASISQESRIEVHRSRPFLFFCNNNNKKKKYTMSFCTNTINANIYTYNIISQRAITGIAHIIWNMTVGIRINIIIYLYSVRFGIRIGSVLSPDDDNNKR